MFGLNKLKHLWQENDHFLNDLVSTLMMMDKGLEFEYSHDQLNTIADRLIAGEDVNL